MASADRITTELEAQAIAQFDSLNQKGELFYEPTEETTVEQEPFDVHFRISTINQTKPFNPNDKSRKPGFLDDDPEFTLCQVQPNHKLILNKYCWVRPQMILHTRDFQAQTELLTLDDFEASSDVLRRLGERYMVIFNGGPDAGSSVAHKHLQVFLRPGWGSVADGIVGGGCEVRLPFEHRLARAPQGLQADGLFGMYKDMCRELSISSGDAHNLLLVKEWMMVVPRSTGSIQGEIPDAPLQGGGNALIGMLWLKSYDQLENWKRYGPMNVLTDFGRRASISK
ncbi:hypothetical protein PMZ80_009911 [Knufia obscura]|uniref:Ap4A phosphorylase II n=1 Tax=Knufia obscura TaxID=1635080 RepID=A0ABR0RB19_9EURO|nr:hypothetical protein PMZ80_009911 [Knufia obscura]